MPMVDGVREINARNNEIVKEWRGDSTTQTQTIKYKIIIDGVI